ncbi:MAG: hypothetical protein HY898_20445 [Deltaproteobacteria bacterium]|nr:hypothetical protein [Deltaproteobacteria bacterium]
MANKRTSLDDYPTNFKVSLADRVRAAAGLPAHMRRKRRIEDLEGAMVLALKQVLDEAEAEFGVGSQEADEALRERAQELDLGLLNDLIERHNRYYPIEANLPTDVATGKLMVGSQPWAPEPLMTHDHFIERVRELRKG